jgi:Flp pilus assembly protein TadG
MVIPGEMRKFFPQAFHAVGIFILPETGVELDTGELRLRACRHAVHPRSLRSPSTETSMNTFASSRRSRRGAISILTAIGALVLLMIIGLGIDTALVMTANQQLQRAADAAALAAANQFQYAVPDDNWNAVRQKAIETAALQSVIRCGTLQLADNPTNAPAGSGRTDMLIGAWRFNRITHAFEFVRTDFATGNPRPNAIQVYPRCGDGTANSALALLFSPLFGATATSDVGRPATAVLAPRDQPLILVLDPTGAQALHFNGGISMDVQAGTIHVDSSDVCAFETDGTSGVLMAQRTRIVGDVCISSTSLTGDLITHSFYVPDPLASLPAPVSASMTNHDRIQDAGTYDAGYYPRGINVNGGTVTLNPGVYYIEQGIKLTGNTVLVGNNVCLYLASSNFDTNGGAGLQITPPLSGPYAGISYFQARSNTMASSIGGTGMFEIVGTTYFPNATFGMSGNASRTIGRIVVWRLDISGNAGYVITGLGVPPTTDPPHVFLVK